MQTKLKEPSALTLAFAQTELAPNYIQGKQKTSTPAEIDRLKAENERLRSALSEISNAFTAYGYSDAMDAVQTLRDIAKEALNADR